MFEAAFLRRAGVRFAADRRKAAEMDLKFAAHAAIIKRNYERTAWYPWLPVDEESDPPTPEQDLRPLE